MPHSSLTPRNISPAATSPFDAYGDLLAGLLQVPAEFGFFDARARCLGHRGRLREAELAGGLKRCLTDPSQPSPAIHVLPLGQERAVVLVMQDAGGKVLGALIVQLPLREWQQLGTHPQAVVATRLQPAMPLLVRDLMARTSTRADVMTERTQELEWLFAATARLGSRGDEQQLQSLLAEACSHIGAVFGAIMIPEKRLRLVHEGTDGKPLQEHFERSARPLLTWVQRQARPLVINAPPRTGTEVHPCRVLAVPVVNKPGKVSGLLAFFNPLSLPEFASRHVYLARHLGRQMGAILASQFDLATGLYTRTALEREFGKYCPESGPDGCVLYVDIDRLHLINETHGFEIGDETIVRIADLLAPPLLPKGALAARISGDRFAIVLPGIDTGQAAEIAAALQRSAAQIRIGPDQETAEISISCGIAGLADVPQALARSLAAAELACKAAKDHGRSRIEIYTTNDSSMMRRQGDVLAVGRLRAALSEDRLLLYAQKIVPLQDRNKPCGYEILLRMRDESGRLVAPGEFISAAQRYQLLPSIDRWVVDRTLQQLAPYASILLHQNISMSINVSGQSVGDAGFMRRFGEQLSDSGVAPANITVEITEQTAVNDVARAIDMVRRLRYLGCKFALDDFGTGVNSLTYLKGFPVTRVKIDGSFVRDLLKNGRSRETVKAIVQLARGMQIETVAEFVEDDELAQKVRQLGVDYGQGYAFGKPEALDGLLKRLASEEARRPHRFEFDI